jgi:hypothetical protein
MRNLGLHLMLAALGVAGITAQAITGSPDSPTAIAALERAAVVSPAADILHHQAVESRQRLAFVRL